MQRHTTTAATLFSLALLLLCSCTSFKATNFPGKLVELDADEVSEDSTWIMDDTVYHARRIGVASFIISSVEWDKQAKAHKLVSRDAILSKLGDTRFLSIKEGEYYVILRLHASNDEKTLLLSTFDADALKEEIESGELAARKNREEFLFEGSKDELDAYLSAEADPPFDAEVLGVLRLLSGELK